MALTKNVNKHIAKFQKIGLEVASEAKFREFCNGPNAERKLWKMHESVKIFIPKTQ
jgi:biotin operon repressor